jgi:hypothetical protein
MDTRRTSDTLPSRRGTTARLRTAAALLILAAAAPALPASSQENPSMQPATPTPSWFEATARGLEEEMGAGLDAAARARLHRGLEQLAGFWRAEDGDAAAFEAFVRRSFAADEATHDALFERFEGILEQIDGHMNEITLALRRQADLDLGPILPFDEDFAAYDPAAHLLDDFFANRLAFTVLLSFPLTTLEERVGEGAGWSRRQWAEARLAERFSKRIPAAVSQAVAKAAAAADQYIAEYNIWMHHVVDGDGRRLFPPGLRLLSHWNLRDEIKADYADGDDGLAKQRTIQKVMEHIVYQTIPEVVVDNPWVDWNPFANTVRPAAERDAPGEPPANLAAGGAVAADREPDTRYAVLLETFRASRLVDPYSPTAPTLIARRFDEDREIPEERVRAMFDQLLTSPQLAATAALIRRRLGRPLEPFDIWYNGFRPRAATTEAELDDLVAERYPTPEAYERDIPNLLEKLGFPPARAHELATNIVVDPARGSGHAWGAQMRSAKSHLRTRVEPGGMNYKGFNIAVHEMGHNVEQTISLNDIDHTLLAGVPNTAFTEALAFVFQDRDLELLGLASDDAEREALSTLDSFWGAAEIASVALVDMAVWHWMYDHPQAAPAELREATVGIAREVWNRYWAPLVGVEDVVLLGVYSHMIHSFLYLPDYPLGHFIAFQIEEQVKQAGNVGGEIERMARQGRIAPDLWMTRAAGAPVGPEALLAATRRALEQLGVELAAARPEVAATR